MSEYKKLVEELMDMKTVNTEAVNAQIAKQYERLYKQYRTQLLTVIDSNNRLKEAWLRDQMKAIGHELDRMQKENANVITKGMEQIINRTTKTQEDYFNKAAEKAGLPKDTFTGMFSSMNRKVVQEVVAGGIYKDGRGLSDRIWSDAKQSKVDLEYIITEGLSAKRSVYDVAKDLEQYVNPDVRVDYEWKKRYPNAGKKTVEYNAYRLATTSMSHAYQTTLKRTQESNPFITGIEWSGGHDTNSCQICKERNGKVYQSKTDKGRFTTEPLPLDHPNGLCKNIPYIPDDLDKIGSRLRDWADGKPDKDLDKWFKDHGSKYTNVEDIQKEMKKPKKKKEDSTAWLAKQGMDLVIDPSAKEVFDKLPKGAHKVFDKFTSDMYAKYPKLAQSNYKLNRVKFLVDEGKIYQAHYSAMDNEIVMNLAGFKRGLEEGLSLEDIKNETATMGIQYMHEFAHYMDSILGRESLKGNKYKEVYDSDGSFKEGIKGSQFWSSKKLKNAMKELGYEMSKQEILNSLGANGASHINESIAEAYSFGHLKDYVDKEFYETLYKTQLEKAERDMTKDMTSIFEKELERVLGKK